MRAPSLSGFRTSLVNRLRHAEYRLAAPNTKVRNYRLEYERMRITQALELLDTYTNKDGTNGSESSTEEESSY